MIFKKVLKKISSTLHVKVEKKSNCSGGKIIEFIGPSGVGKSTLYELTKNNLSSVWNSSQKINKYQLISTDGKLIDTHWEIFKNKLNFIDSLKTNSIEKLKLVGYFNTVLLNNIKLMQIQDEFGFFLEEGICHNFSRELLALNNEELLSVIRNRCLICVLPKDSMTVVNQLRKRAKDGGHTVFHHTGLDDEELNELSKDSTQIFIKFLDCIQKFKIPICQLYAEDGLEINSKKIIEFEASLFN